MCTVRHVDKYKITFKLVINSRRNSRGPVPDRGPAVEKNYFKLYSPSNLALILPHSVRISEQTAIISQYKVN